MYLFSGIRQSVPYISVADDDDGSEACLVEGQIVSETHLMNFSGANVSAANIR